MKRIIKRYKLPVIKCHGDVISIQHKEVNNAVLYGYRGLLGFSWWSFAMYLIVRLLCVHQNQHTIVCQPFSSESRSVMSNSIQST